MITFKEFLLGEATVKSWELEAVELKHLESMIEVHCKKTFENAIKNGGVLYRGDKATKLPHFSVIDTTESSRTSRDTSNLYQLMMDTSPGLKDVPSRSKSLICSASYGAAFRYGPVHVVLPFDDVEVAYSPKIADFLSAWVKSSLIEAHVDDVSHLVGRMFTDMDIRRGPEGGEQYTDAQHLNNKLAKIDKDSFFIHMMRLDLAKTYFQNFTNAQALADTDKTLKLLDNGSPLTEDGKKLRAITDAFNPKARFTELCNEIFNHRTINITIMPAFDFHKSTEEVWFSGKCLMMRAAIFASLAAKEPNIHPKIQNDLSNDIKAARKAMKITQ